MSNLVSMFRNVKSKNKIYCIEASAVTYNILPKVKKHVIDVLNNQARKGDNGKFNIICFNSDVAKWCVSLVPCTSEHVSVGEEWLRHIQPIGTCNFVGSIISALREPISHSICAIVAQEPDESIDEILDMFAYIGRKTQIHIRLCLLTSDFTEDMQAAHDIYSQIAEATNGTFAVVKFNADNEITVIKGSKSMRALPSDTDSSKELSEGNHLIKTEMMQVLPGTYIDETTGEVYPMCKYKCDHSNYKPFDFWKRITPSQSFLECLSNHRQKNFSNIKTDTISSLAASLIVGRKVLARKYSDGQYYVGTVKEQVDTDLFKVVLGPYNTPTGEYIATDYQKTKLLDLIDLDDAWKRSIMPGDRVLAPDPADSLIGDKPFRYITGTVLDGYIFRDYFPTNNAQKAIVKAFDSESKMETSKNLVIEFTNPINKTEKVSCEQVIYIPEPFYQRLCLEGAMPKAARENLYKVTNYPENSMPGYPTSGSKKNPKDYTFSQMNIIKGRNLQIDFLMPPYCLPIYPVIDILEKEELNRGFITKGAWNSGVTNRKSDNVLNKEDLPIPDSIYTVKELAMKVTDQIEQFKHLSPTKGNMDKAMFRKNMIKTSEASTLVSRHPIQKKDRTQISMNTRGISTHSYENDEETTQRRDSKIKRILSRNFSIHDKYYDELEKIRETGSVFIDDSMSYTTDKEKSDVSSLTDKVKFNGQFESILRPSRNANNTVPITDIGENDKVRETNNRHKLEQRRLQVEKRLQLEKERFCDEERRRDLVDEYRRGTANRRVVQFNDNHHHDDTMIEKTQSLKRDVVADIESQVEQIAPCQIKPDTTEEIDRKRIELMRQRRAARDNEAQKRNEDALRYIEKLEENKRHRCDSRWWDAQKQMLKGYPEKI